MKTDEVRQTISALPITRPIVSTADKLVATSMTSDDTSPDSPLGAPGIGTGIIPNIASNPRFGVELIEKTGAAGKTHFKQSKQVLTFGEYLDEVMQTPTKYLRPSAKYVLDSFEYWNKQAGINPKETTRVLGHDVRPFAFVQKPWEPDELIDRELVRGQMLFWNNLYRDLEVLSRKKHPNRMIIVHGPNATGKSRIFETLFEELEQYSKTDEGAVYTFDWVFDERSTLGLDAIRRQQNGEDEPKGPIKPEDVVMRIPAGKNMNPIFLLDKSQRVDLVNELERQGKLPEGFNRDYVIAGDMNDLSSRIYKSLWRNYRGDVSKVLNHVHVTRWEMSSLSRKGLVLIQPEVTPHAVLTPVTPDIDWSGMPRYIAEAIRTANIHQIEGDFAEGDRGVVVYDDIFKETASGVHNMEDHLHLLRGAEKSRSTVATSRRSMGSHTVDESFDFLLFGTTNDDTLTQLAQKYDEWDSLRARFIFEPVGFERNYTNVAQVFEHQLEQLIPEECGRHISPHVLETFGLWLTMTYLFPPKNINYYNSQEVRGQKERYVPILNHLSTLEKALLYADQDPNSNAFEDPRYGQAEKDLLRRNVDLMEQEYNLGVGKHKFFFYEGSHGLSSRIGEQILNDAISHRPNVCFSTLELFDVLEDWIVHGFEFEQQRQEFLGRAEKAIAEMRSASAAAAGGSKESSRIPVVPEFPTTRELLRQVKGHEARRIQYDVRKALGCMRDKEEQTGTLKKYIAHARAHVSSKSVTQEYRDPSNSEQPNLKFMDRLEKMFLSSTNESEVDKFRKQIKQKIGDWAVDHGGQDPLEHVADNALFADLLEKMDAYDMEANKKRVEHFLQDLRTYVERGGKIEDHNIMTLDPKRAESVHRGIDFLTYKSTFKKYIELARNYQPTDPEDVNDPNLKFMRRIEKEFFPSKANEVFDATQFRTNIGQRIATWEGENKSANPLDHLAEIFPDLLPEDAMDYCEKCLPKLVYFAFETEETPGETGRGQR